MSREQSQIVNLNELDYISDVKFESQRQSISASKDDVIDLTLNERLT